MAHSDDEVLSTEEIKVFKDWFEREFWDYRRNDYRYDHDEKRICSFSSWVFFIVYSIILFSIYYFFYFVFKKEWTFILILGSAFEYYVYDRWRSSYSKYKWSFEFGRSGEMILDRFICDRNLKWIPYDQFTNIKYFDKGGFSVIYKANWLNNENKEIIFKCYNNLSENLNEFLNEWEYHKRCLNSIDIIKFYGFTRNPDTLNYMVVIDYANKGNLRGNLTKIIKKNWKQKLHMLYKIISGLSKIHRENLIHCDFHDGNILIHVESDEDKIFIGDLGLCRPVKSFLQKDDIYGVIPFMAPEILRGKSYTPASDIYSFSMIMWEFTSGVPPFNNRAHDIQLSISICKGERPEIIENTPQCYVDLMKMCWNEDPLKRPSSGEVLDIVGEWIFFPENGIMNKGLKSNVMEFINAPIRPNNLATESHPQVYYISRLLNFSSKELNETLKSKDLQAYYASHSTSGKVDEMLISFESEDLQSYYASQSTSGKVNEIPVSEDLDDCIIIDIND